MHTIWTGIFVCLISICTSPVAGWAQSSLSGGATYQNGVLFASSEWRLYNFAVEAGFGMANYQTIHENITLPLAGAFLFTQAKLYFNFGIPVELYVGVGGSAVVLQIAEAFGEQDVPNSTTMGIKITSGVDFRAPWFPINLFVAGHFSTVHRATFQFTDGSDSFLTPIKGISGFSWSVGLQYEFNTRKR